MFPKAKAIRNSDKNTTTNPIRYINMINDINIFDDFPVSNVLIHGARHLAACQLYPFV